MHGFPVLRLKKAVLQCRIQETKLKWVAESLKPPNHHHILLPSFYCFITTFFLSRCCFPSNAQQDTKINPPLKSCWKMQHCLACLLTSAFYLFLLLNNLFSFKPPWIFCLFVFLCQSVCLVSKLIKDTHYKTMKKEPALNLPCCYF